MEALLSRTHCLRSLGCAPAPESYALRVASGHTWLVVRQSHVRAKHSERVLLGAFAVGGRVFL